MEGRQINQRIRASSLSKTKHQDSLKQSATPIKEELIEEDFDDMNSNSRSMGIKIEEAKNYDSILSESKDNTRSILKNKSGDKTHDSGKTIQGSLAMFKVNQNVTQFEDIAIEVESEEYKDDDFGESSGSELLAKISVSQSGRLPPLSSSYPHGATKSLTGSFIFGDSKDGKNSYRDKSNPKNA